MREERKLQNGVKTAQVKWQKTGWRGEKES